jgi:tRNA U55 pseudouridine synthase TruB
VRSLGRDLAASLGTAAVMAALQRTAVGGFRIAEAAEPQQITRENLGRHLLPPLRAVERLPRVELSAAEIARVGNGLSIQREMMPGGTGGLPTSVEHGQTSCPCHPRQEIAAQEIAAVDENGRLVAILAHRGPGLLGPTRNLPL